MTVAAFVTTYPSISPDSIAMSLRPARYPVPARALAAKRRSCGHATRLVGGMVACHVTRTLLELAAAQRAGPRGPSHELRDTLVRDADELRDVPVGRVTGGKRVRGRLRDQERRVLALLRTRR